MAEHSRLGDHISSIKNGVPQMISGIKELARAEIVPSAKHASIGGAGVGAVAAFGLFLLHCLLWAAVFGIAVFFHSVAGFGWFGSMAFAFLTLAAVSLILMIVFGLIAVLQFRQVRAPTATIAEAKASISSLSNAVAEGVSEAERGVIDRHGDDTVTYVG
ncbi:phage holin family protein [uncultured Propionibacterium sp.]|uniref:phage holin family protein n=1 Tax=uncultured Propionibacterium sp. TaxID=218066 RepID=UPI002931918F|nr:phage holin family protein [uncultured Propionibacterium sp.]